MSINFVASDLERFSESLSFILFYFMTFYVTSTDFQKRIFFKIYANKRPEYKFLKKVVAWKHNLWEHWLRGLCEGQCEHPNKSASSIGRRI